MAKKIAQLLFSFLFNTVIINISFNSLTVSGQAIYSEKEIKALNEFRGLVGGLHTQDFQKSDSYLIRWLRDKDLDIAAATEAYQKNIKWRKENNIDSIMNETVIEFNVIPFMATAFAYEGHPVITFSPTVLDMRQLILSGSRNADKLVRLWDQILERGERRIELASIKSNGTVYQGISMMDLQRFNIRQHTCLRCVRVFLDWAIHYENYHPLMAKHVIWINVPRSFVPIVQLVKPLFSSGTQKALKLFPADRKEWSTYISKIISPEELTIQFGGTKPNSI